MITFVYTSAYTIILLLNYFTNSINVFFITFINVRWKNTFAFHKHVHTVHLRRHLQSLCAIAVKDRDMPSDKSTHKRCFLFHVCIVNNKWYRKTNNKRNKRRRRKHIHTHTLECWFVKNNRPFISIHRKTLEIRVQ